MHNVNQSFCVIAAQQAGKKKKRKTTGKVSENLVQTIPGLQLSGKKGSDCMSLAIY